VSFYSLSRVRFPLPNRRIAIIAVGLLTVAIAFLDWLIVPNVSLGLLYFLPILLAAHLAPREIAALALVSTLLREQFGPLHWGDDLAARSVITFIAFLGVGLLAREIDLHQKTVEAYARALADQVQLRGVSEQQLRGLVEGSPAPILTLDPEGRVLMANEATHELLRCASQSLPGQSIDAYLPALAALRETTRVRHVIRTLIECTGHRLDGEAFLAQVWVSSYGAPGAMDLSVVIFDSSEQLRNREEVSMEALATGARVIMGGFWHEIRNLCTAMRLSVNSLQQRPGMADAEEVEGLRSLMNGLERLTASGLRPESPQTFDVASLRAILDHLRIVIEPWFQESQMTVRWQETPDLLLIRADHHGLLQVCLNLARNAHRALQRTERKEFTIRSTVEGGQVFLRFHNTGVPIADAEALFRPFQPAAAGSGLGLYVSRAIVRSFGGNLRYEPVADGCCFAVVLERADLPFMVYGEKTGDEDPRVAS
jgi:two-component system, LuxR family, sensor kinase FixL